MPIYLPDKANLDVLDLIMKVLETMVGAFLISILELAAVSKIELIILHFLHDFLIVLPIRLDLLQVYRRLLAFYSLEHFLIL